MAPTWLIRWDTVTERRPSLTGSINDQAADPSKSVSWGGGYDSATVGDQNEGGFAAFDGYLFDKENYKQTAKRNEAAWIAQSYADWGEGLFDQLRGGFALAIWDQKQERLIAGRDAMGLHPCYYYWNGRLFLLSPDLDLILTHPKASGQVNRLILAEYLQSTWHSHQRFDTFYENVSRLPAAHWLCLSNGRLEIVRYWDPLPPGFQWASQEELQTLEQNLERAAVRCLEAGADSLALSGGFDSVSLAILAAKQLRGKRPLHAVSLRFTIDAVDEGETQLAVARALGMPQVMRTIDECLNDTSLVEASLALSKISPLPVLSPWQVIYTNLFDSAGKLGLSRLMLGTGGDEMFTVDLAFGADRLAALDMIGLWRFYRAMARTSPFSTLRVAKVVLWEMAAKPEGARRVRNVLDRVSPAYTDRLRRRHLAPSPWLAPSDPALRRSILDRRLSLPEQDDTTAEGAYLQRIRGLLLSPLLMAEHEQGHSWAHSIGFTMFFPFFDRDLVALALRIHPEILISGGRAKTPLRRLVVEQLQDVDMPVRKVDFNRPFHDTLIDHGRKIWDHLKGAQILSDLRLVDPGLLNPLMDDFFSGRNDAWLDAWQVLSTETWLQSRFI